jgi:stearoyl-CoA desaturase (Delta-9 desaturase)
MEASSPDTVEDLRVPDVGGDGPRPLWDVPRTRAGQITMWVFVIGPFFALVAAVPLAWGQGLSALDATMAIVAYLVSGFGLTAGYHRLFTHRSFKAVRGLRIALAVAGSFGIEGSPIQWVANHRRHHAFADREGDPHSPWRYGTSPAAVVKGLLYAHLGWMLRRELSNRARFAPDLVADRDMRMIGRLFGPLAAASLLVPALIGGVVTGTWTGALSALFWAGIVRMTVPWSVNSICHVVGERPFSSRDLATNVWPLALPSLGESWHNSHHADPTCARHGVLPGQIDPTARLIWLFERLRWAYQVRWPTRTRLARLRAR